MDSSNLGIKNIDEFIRKMIKENEQRANELLKRQQQERINKLLMQSGLGERFKYRTFESFKVNEDNQNAYAKCKIFADRFKEQERGLLLIGEVGRGKTHLAAAVSNKLIQQLYTVLFGNITNLISLIRSTYSKESEITEKEILGIMCGVDLLVVDDLGKESSTSNTISLIYQIINRRYEDNKPVIVTTNCTSNELKRTIGEATVSRLFEMCEPIQLAGKDWRLARWEQS